MNGTTSTVPVSCIKFIKEQKNKYYIEIENPDNKSKFQCLVQLDSGKFEKLLDKEIFLAIIHPETTSIA